MATFQTSLLPELETLVQGLDIAAITEDRKAVLRDLSEFIRSKILKQADIRINFICTHNSRRSHLAQVWAQTIAHYFNVRNVSCYSGGTEVTALFPMIAETLKSSGFEVRSLSAGENPVSVIKYSDNAHPIVAFSKKYDDLFNPKSAFAAVMTCASANESCPYVSGAEKRISIPFQDPKIFDETSLKAEKYKECSLRIATELFYVFSKVKA